MAERLDKHILKNGMVLLGEPMEQVQSVAFDFMLPGGAARLPEGCCGAGNVIADWIFRGAGEKDSRELGDALDGLGLHRSTSVGSSHITLAASLQADKLTEALDLYSDIILKASLEEEQFKPAKQLAIDSVKALDDDPRQKVMLKLREQFYPGPLGRSSIGEIAELEALTSQKTREIISNTFNPSETIFAVAGKYDFEAIISILDTRFSNLDTNIKNQATGIEHQASSKYTHLHNDGAQVHIGLMTGTVKPADKDYYNARVAVSVLSGGMSARLFTEVREKRGLCYAIGARYHGLKEAAGIMCYAGTTPEKAQETLDCIVSEFEQLDKGISKEEIERAKVGLKASLIMQNESTSNRASGIGGDYYLLGRVRSLDEIKNKIEATSADSVLEFLQRNKFKDFSIVTIGPKEIQF